MPRSAVASSCHRRDRVARGRTAAAGACHAGAGTRRWARAKPPRHDPRSRSDVHHADTAGVATSPHDVASTVARVETALHARGVTLFAAVDRAAGAREAGLELADEVLLVFGNPKVGTGLMQADPTVGIELPLRLLIWDEQGTTHIAFSDPAELASR